MNLPLFLSATAGVCLGSALVHGQTMQSAPNQIPQGSPFNASYTEAVDFADVDLDGDLDAAWADGGDWGNDQNRLWINQGGAQGGTPGFFLDVTSVQFPAVLDDSRDLDFVDFDGDGDWDLNVTNTASVTLQSNRWWVNMGGAQGGTSGFFQDETSTRWVNLGVNNGSTSFSSIPANLVLPGGGFVDWSCDAVLGDLDGDGDMDVFHSSYGGGFFGRTPSRIFLNDSSGAFEEFNPSGFQLASSQIADGDPGLWCEGTHQQATTNATGQQCDIADTPLGVELGDLDGDLDIDVLQGARNEDPRIFRNQLREHGSFSAFRDVSHAALPAGWAPGTGHYENELGDFDNDGDLDLYGVNWESTGSSLNDSTLRNNGSGVFGFKTVMTNSQPDDNACVFVDYDADGSLDVYVANWSGQDRMYRNSGPPAYSLSYQPTGVALPPDSSQTLAADSADVDGDGDYDIFVANNANQANVFLKNTSQVADVTAPRVTHLEQAPDRSAGAPPTVIRAHVYDNASWPIVGFNPTRLEYRVNGGAFAVVGMRFGGGQLFRGEIPGSLVGTIEYFVRSTDEHGNAGVSPLASYSATPCTGGPQPYCTAKTNSLGCTPAISFSGVPSATAAAGFTVSCSRVRNNEPGVLFYGVEGRSALPFQGGTLCVDPPIRRTLATISGGTPPPAQDCSGVYSIDMNAFAAGGLGGSPLPALTVAGTLVHCQWWGRDPGFPAPNNTSLSNGLQYSVCP